MVRFTTKQSGFSSDNLIVGFVLVLAIGLFTTIVMWPHSPKTGPVLRSVDTTPLGTQLNDRVTLEYLTVLQRVKPKISNQLHSDAEAVIAAGGDKDDLAMLILASLDEGIDDDKKKFFQADVKYFDQTLTVTQKGLQRLAAHAPQYCQVSHYEHLANSDPDTFVAELSKLIGYRSEGYNFALALGQSLLEGVEDAQKSPNRYGRLSAKDETAFRNVMMNMMSNKQVSVLMSMQSMPPAQQKRAVAKLDFCDLANDIILDVLSLPEDTKKRMMGEVLHMAKSGKMDGALQSVTSGF